LGVTLNSTYSQLRQQQSDLNQEIKVTVGSINSLGRQIQSLNRQIALMELDGSNANDLRDQRALLIDKLSRLVNIEVRETETNPDFAAGRVTDPRVSRRELSIFIDGFVFVNHFDVNEIHVQQRTLADSNTNIRQNPEEVGAMYDIFWANGMRFDMYSPSLRGELAGLINLRDGNGGLFANFETVASAGTAPVFVPGTPPTVTMHFGPHSRVDLGETGIITVRNAGGTVREFRYTGFEFTDFDANGHPISGTFTLYEGDNPDAAHFTNPNTNEITIGRTTTYMGIPYFMSRLNEMTRTLAAAFNEGRYLNGGGITDVIGHRSGLDLNGNQGGWLLGYNGFDFATGTGMNYFNITAANFMVNPTIKATPALLALASSTDTLPSGNHIVHSWARINTDRGMFKEGRLGDFISSIIGDLGITGRQAENFARSYNEMVETIDNQRRAISGVSLDEETANMIQHQIVFQAAARLFSVIDNIYETLILRVGSW
jgi:flagellar hook-associated protein 1 FlgK